MPLAAETLKVLHGPCPGIRSICIIFPPDMGKRILGYECWSENYQPGPSELERRDIYGQPDVSAFAGLEELVLK